jgi:hypothetical protein
LKGGIRKELHNVELSVLCFGGGAGVEERRNEIELAAHQHAERLNALQRVLLETQQEADRNLTAWDAAMKQMQSAQLVLEMENGRLQVPEPQLIAGAPAMVMGCWVQLSPLLDSTPGIQISRLQLGWHVHVVIVNFCTVCR